MFEVIRSSEDGLSDKCWRFSTWTEVSSDRVVLSLTEYLERSRATTRHKMKPARRWSRMDQRSYYSDIPAQWVPLPDDVAEEARGRITFVIAGATD